MVTIGEAASGTDLPNVETGIPRFPRTRGDRPLAATAQHGPEDLGVGIAQRAQRRGGPPPLSGPGCERPTTLGHANAKNSKSTAFCY